MIHQLALDFNKINEILAGVLKDGPENSEETTFVGNVKMAIINTFVDMLCMILKDRPRKTLVTDIKAKVGDIRTALSTIVKAKRNGAFSRFELVSVKIGGNSLEFPDEAVKKLIEAVSIVTSNSEVT